MKCPNCKEEISTVNVFSELRQSASVDKEGNISNYEPWSTKDVSDEAIGVECPLCYEDLERYIKSY
jgi:hypothetical protein